MHVKSLHSPNPYPITAYTHPRNPTSCCWQRGGCWQRLPCNCCWQNTPTDTLPSDYS